MRVLVPLLLLSALGIAGETVALPEVGLRIEMPDGWDRESSREQGAIKFAALYDYLRDRFVRFSVSTAPAENYSPDVWLQAQKQQTAKWLKETTRPFEPGKIRVGGREVDGFTCAGKMVSGDKEFDLHLRVAGLVHQGLFYELTELSYNNAHTEQEVAGAIEKMWQGIHFDRIQAQAVDVDVVEGEPLEVIDEEGNWKTKLPPGWVRTREPSQEDEEGLRLTAERQNDNGDQLALFVVFKFTSGNQATFSTRTPSEVLTGIDKDNRFFEQFYGPGTAGRIHPRLDESKLLGGYEKSGAFEYRSLTAEQQQAIREAEDAVRRGQKGVTVPEFKETVIRGRIALLSPHIYLVFCRVRGEVADDPQIVGEYNQIIDSFEFLSTAAKPNPLRLGPIEFGDTTADPANAKPRKVTAVAQHRGRKIYQLGVQFTVPTGFHMLTDEEKRKVYQNPERISCVLVAQDANNNWVHVIITHASGKAFGDDNKTFADKRETFATWRSNWQNKAPRARMPSKTKKFSMGGIRGEGYLGLEGKVEKFRGTFTALLTDKSNWRTIIEVETRGQGDRVFEEQLKDFYKSLRLKKMKDK